MPGSGLLLRADSIDAAKEVAHGLGYSIDAGAMAIRPGVIELHRLTKPDPDSGDLLWGGSTASYPWSRAPD